ncbi:4-alpha-glucanotransferase [Phreatobacter cathodiphilus]|uniref:4-alpha-glucanotransferase n=1 Tax=Phreatobacter cathodiphilus TaxID=1868589 RepID=A0A2S0NGF6_9HYPH|nr:4-alpha-glucanotransferase [Phreatobacter cathodiphilus]AVO47245.1 4-alpha-glucanotransferase [Phreatobacter cathodiphilus]
MHDEALRELARRSGIALDWRDQRGETRIVSPETLRAILAAMDVGPEDAVPGAAGSPEADRPLLTARAGRRVDLAAAGFAEGALELEDGDGAGSAVQSSGDGTGLSFVAPDRPGYYRLHQAGRTATLAVAPQRSPTITERLGGRGWALASQIYSLRSRHDGGIGNFGGVAALGAVAGERGADAIAVSPTHALFGAAPGHFSPYSPSTRLFANPLHADPVLVLGEAAVSAAIAAAGLDADMAALERAPTVHWEAATPARRALLAALHRRLLASGDGLAADFAAYRAAAPQALIDHATFEVLHEGLLREESGRWHWNGWPDGLREASSPAVAAFRSENAEAVDRQIFAQWLAERSQAAAQACCRDAGMRIGIIADLAIGVESAGSQCWSRPSDMLTGLGIGAPPDYYAAEGQNWGLTTFSPLGLARSGYAGFIAMLRASLAHAGGLRIDHVMGFARLWMVPEGASATEGAYLAMPSEDLFCLTALEASRHDAVVIGEDLGTLPHGYREKLQAEGVAGMRVLRFERDDHGHRHPSNWDSDAVAMTSTHDMIATAGWWRGADLAADDLAAQERRAWDRGLFWGSAEEAGLVTGPRPAPEEPEAAVDAAIAYVAETPSALAVIAVEDLLGLDVQPNVPGTTAEKPNWRHRLPGPAASLLDDAAAGRRIRLLQQRRGSRPRDVP